MTPGSQAAGPIWRDTPPSWRRLEALLFAAVFLYTAWRLGTGLVSYARATAGGRGFIKDLLEPFRNGQYHDSVLAVVGLLISVLTVWELIRFPAVQFRKERAQGRGAVARVFQAAALEYQPTFFTGLLLGLLPRLIVIDVFWLLLPYFRPFALFHVGYAWYGWLYALLLWDLSMWIWHYGAHKVRLLWCLQKPPGWTPGDESHTAANLRRRFLADRPELRAPGGPALLARLFARRPPTAQGAT